MAAIFSMQLYILFSGFWKGIFEGTWETIKININLMVNAEFCAAAVLISFGGVLGKVSPFQLLSMAAFESLIYSLNERVVSQKEDVVDIGGSILIHTFGAYFGLMVSWMISPPSTKNHPHNVPNYISNALTFVGTIFLWIYWPSFNGIYTFGNARHRAVLGTILSLCGSCMSTFIFSRIFKGGLFHMEDILNASLAGGVVIGSTCNIIVDPFVALLLGLIIGMISTWGFEKLSPFLQRTVKLYDTCGIHNLHGMPGVVGGIVSIIIIGTSQDVGEQLNHDSQTQALYQLAGLVTTLAIALVSGFIVGAIIRTEFFEPPKEIFNDKEFWVVESEDNQETEGYRALKIQDP
jgi:ammonium transporter Rh